MKELTIKRLRNTDFSDLYRDFILERQMENRKYFKILALATLFINSQDDIIKKFGYRLVVMYGNQTGNYKPLYEISMNLGIIPITKFIEKKYMNSDVGNLFTEFNAAIGEQFFINNVYCSIEQKNLIDFFESHVDDTLSIVAPTSYGKTDLIMSTINRCQNKNICILTPTKSLLAQTKMRVIQSKIKWIDKIITHPEMYNGNEKNLVAILTQERLLRLLKKSNDIVFDYVIIDEAHGLLHDDDRNILLASVLLVLEKRNKDTTFKFLTPFLCEPENLKVRYADYKIETFKVDEYIKTEKLYYVELRDGRSKEYCIYDQFMNLFYNIPFSNEKHNEIDFVKESSDGKNIIYLNKPKDIENYVGELCKTINKLNVDKIESICNDIAEYVHPKYRLLDCLKHGVIYHHGSVPEPVRIYIEHLYTDLPYIKYVVTSSTLLEGVNLPADKMFILDNKKGNGNLSPSDFKNLIGRVCRFSQIFNSNSGSLKRLEPSIYLVAGKYYSKNANAKKFLIETMCIEKKVTDNLQNVLLEKTEINESNVLNLESAEEFIENYEEGIVENYDLRKTETDVGKACFLNNITEFNIFDYEKEIDKEVNQYIEKELLIDTTEGLFEVLNELFFCRADEQNIARFSHPETRRFYKMFMDWRISNASLNMMIQSFVHYWNSLIEGKRDTLVYVGRWGDTVRYGWQELWTDIKEKTDTEKINLAIVRVKEEQDFLDNTVIKYVEVLHDLKMLDENLYLKIKYGTNNMQIIVLVKNGISLSLAKLLVKDYARFMDIDINNNQVHFKDDILKEMENKNENRVMIYELKYFI